ncbi:MAG: hypothetical protein A2286_03420 [Gammaproteobacteria bacterium RIFOXYA12_FULL_61_12]|nr:MAG: hypothetical protein A2286_03420 [Gammaproteobacteria bacterium RIFOXYA12_FULL_61_12]OGT91289.1 MAG: hypothetical protein A2514_11005 [Gammaproteobacteria bacterium RIFOXYD12_FULL_61_37]
MSYRLKFDIQGYWHPGTGRGQGSHLDATTYRNAQGLPSLPGRTVKGLVRDAVNRWESFGGYPLGDSGKPGITDQLFGPYGAEGTHTWPGLLRFSDAMLPKDDVALLSLAENQALRDGLYRSHFSTAIEHESGTADEKSLRGIELVIPLALYAEVDLATNAAYGELEKQWPDLLRQALPLVRAVGAHRSRGLGRAVVTLLEKEAP